MKVFQIVNGKCHWHTPYENFGKTLNRYPKSCVFVEAPDYVFEGWGYRTKDDEGNAVTGDDRFVQPIPPEGYIYDEDTGRFVPEDEVANILHKAQLAKQEENKTLFAEFLAAHPLLYVDGKYYGVTMEDQTEIQLNMSQYQLQVGAGIENPTLEWHAIQEGCQPWTFEELTALALTISNYIYPWFRKMNEYKTAIFAATTKAEVNAIELIYMTEAEILAAAEVEAEEANTNNDEPVANEETPATEE